MLTGVRTEVHGGYMLISLGDVGQGEPGEYKRSNLIFYLKSIIIPSTVQKAERRLGSSYQLTGEIGKIIRPNDSADYFSGERIDEKVKAKNDKDAVKTAKERARILFDSFQKRRELDEDAVFTLRLSRTLFEITFEAQTDEIPAESAVRGTPDRLVVKT